MHSQIPPMLDTGSVKHVNLNALVQEETPIQRQNDVNSTLKRRYPRRPQTLVQTLKNGRKCEFDRRDFHEVETTSKRR